MRKKNGRKVLCRIMEWVNILVLSISLYNVLHVGILKNTFLSPDSSQSKALMSGPLLFPAVGKPHFTTLPALRKQTLSWGVPRTDFKWTNCILILPAAVFGEAAVLRCLIIPHLWGHSIALWEPNHVWNFWCQRVFWKMDGLAFPQNAAFTGGVFHLTCREQCVFQAVATMNGTLWTSSL